MPLVKLEQGDPEANVEHIASTTKVIATSLVK